VSKLKPYDPLADVRKDPAAVREFFFNPGALRNWGHDAAPLAEFPRELLQCENLERLHLFRGLAGAIPLPADLGRLSRLRTLELGGLGFEELPPSLGDLGRLEKLDLSYAHRLRTLPRTIGRLKALTTLAASYSSLAELPAEIGELSSLRELNLGQTPLTEVPPQLWNAGELRTLRLPDGVVDLPPGVNRLRKLEILAISGQALLTIAAELPRLQTLRELWVVGKAMQLPEEVAELASLTVLAASHLGLTRLPARLGTLAELTRLAVAGNALTELGPIVSALPKLKELDFSGNPMGRNEKKLVQALMATPPSRRARVAKSEPSSAPVGKGAQNVRYLEYRSASSNKFWEITLEKKGFVVRFGKLGAKGQTSQKKFDSAEEARRQQEKLIAEKVQKGYVERGQAGATSKVCRRDNAPGSARPGRKQHGVVGVAGRRRRHRCRLEGRGERRERHAGRE
jgi:predicted DNA-binding WGR domain protein